MAANKTLFDGPARVQTFLSARGFDAKSGARSGGIKDPLQVTVPSESVLLRTYQDPARLWGEWWFTPGEMAQVIRYFARERAALAAGRSHGKGILQAIMAVRHEWGGKSKDHMGLIAAVSTAAPLLSFLGEGDAAHDATQQRNLKLVWIQDVQGRRRGVRQIYLPAPGTYASSFHIIEREVPSDSDMIRLVRAYGSAALPFEQ